MIVIITRCTYTSHLPYRAALGLPIVPVPWLHCLQPSQSKDHPKTNYKNVFVLPTLLLGLIEHHGVFIEFGHYVSYIRQSNKWNHCDDKHITETNLLTLSNNVYLMFYAKEVDLGT